MSTDLKVVPRTKPVQDKNVPFRLRQPEQGVLDRAGLIRAVKGAAWPKMRMAQPPELRLARPPRSTEAER